MTQFSFHWGCGSTGDQGNVTVDKMFWMNMILGNANPATDGVIYWTNSNLVPPFSGFSNAVNGLLAPSNPSGSVVRIASGMGLVQGWLFINDANVDFDIASDLGNASATDLIVLEKSVTNQTVRLARVKGAAGTIATVTQNSTTWQIPIAQVALTAGGDFSSLTNVRTLAHPPVGSVVKIAEQNTFDGTTDTVTFSNIPPLFRDLRVVVMGRSDDAEVLDTLNLLFNSGGGNYDYALRNVNGAGTTSNTTAVNSSLGAVAAFLSGADAPAGAAGSAVIDIPNYRSSLHKVAHGLSTFKTGTTTADINTAHAAIHWRDTTAINRVVVSLAGGDFVAGSRVALYGII